MPNEELNEEEDFLNPTLLGPDDPDEDEGIPEDFKSKSKKELYAEMQSLKSQADSVIGLKEAFSKNQQPVQQAQMQNYSPLVDPGDELFANPEEFEKQSLGDLTGAFKKVYKAATSYAQQLANQATSENLFSLKRMDSEEGGIFKEVEGNVREMWNATPPAGRTPEMFDALVNVAIGKKYRSGGFAKKEVVQEEEVVRSRAPTTEGRTTPASTTKTYSLRYTEKDRIEAEKEGIPLEHYLRYKNEKGGR
jgi:hypothetical protein